MLTRRRRKLQQKRRNEIVVRRRKRTTTNLTLTRVQPMKMPVRLRRPDPRMQHPVKAVDVDAEEGNPGCPKGLLPS